VTTNTHLIPVGVYIYGGGPHGGSSSDGRYNLSFIVQSAAEAHMPFIAVSFNYRSSLFGFLDSRAARGDTAERRANAEDVPGTVLGAGSV
jgi:carboxylesterase type B